MLTILLSISLLLFVGGGLVLESLILSFVLLYLLMFFNICSLTWWLVFDNLSFILSGLTVWLFILLFLNSNKYKNFKFESFKKIITFLFVFLMLVYSSMSLLGFYVFFEISLLPLIYIIFGWGYQVERIQATFYLFVYTVVGSFPLLFFFVFMWENLGWFFFKFYNLFMMNEKLVLMMLFVCFAFFVKLPLYSLHLWLPKAHVEAPAVGSMVLAAVLLKLSLLGMYRSFYLLSFEILFNNIFLISLLFWGSFLSSMVALKQSDVKSLVAYSSISHMGVMLGGFFMVMNISVKGGIIVMLAHGFCSSAMFYLCNIHYEQHNSRQILVLSGSMMMFFGISVWWFLFLIMNFSVPPFLSLWGEVMIFIQTVYLNFKFFILLMFVGFLVALFSMFLYSLVVVGNLQSMKSVLMVNNLHHLSLVFHLFPMFFCVFSFSFMFSY